MDWQRNMKLLIFTFKTCNNHQFGSCKTLIASFVYVRYWVHMYDLLDTAVNQIQKWVSHNIWYYVQRSDVSMIYTGHFIMFSMITNIYNKKTKGPTLMELFTATGKQKKKFFLLLEMFDVCTMGDTAHIYMTRHWPKGMDDCSSEEYQCTHVDAYVGGKNLNIVSMCHPWCTHRASIVVKKKLFQFSCGCEQFHLGPLGLLLQMFVITENIMKLPVYFSESWLLLLPWCNKSICLASQILLCVNCLICSIFSSFL
jgi:hypothetical protein